VPTLLGASITPSGAVLQMCERVIVTERRCWDGELARSVNTGMYPTEPKQHGPSLAVYIATADQTRKQSRFFP